MPGCRAWIGLIWLGVVIASGAGPAHGQTPDSRDAGARVARVGVLAYRGADVAVSRWRPLAGYLSQAVPGWRFDLVPMTLVSAPKQIEDKQVDFVITNPGHYVTLAERFGLSALSTRERQAQSGGIGLLQFGTVIFTRNDSAIQGLDDLKGRKIAAVSPDAFGGFQLAWYEMQAQGIDVFADLGAIRFMGFPQDAIVFSVLEGEADAGIVRSGLLELLAAEGRLDAADMRVLNANMQLDYPHRISSRLYPEWPFAALPGIDKSLRENVLRVLLQTQDAGVSTQYGLRDTWSAPLAYGAVRALVSTYRSHLEGEPGGLAASILATTVLAAAVIGLTLLTAYSFMRRRPGSGRPSPASGEPGLDPELEAALERFEKLTPREREVLFLICNGSQTKTIAHKLQISPKTVEFHRTNLLHKTDAGTTPHLVQLATRLGFDQGLSPG
jgi:ABC-type phosphate/phosphonate transport system substrate-binding protein/DNA-binding CsgD family transcriptional regulator